MYSNNIYGDALYAEDVANSNDIEKYTPDLFRYLPEDYHTSVVYINILNSVAKRLGELGYYRQDLINQYFVSTATWGLSIWENILGIKTNISKSYEERRDVIKSKIVGFGTLTKSKLKEIAKAYTNADIDIIEDSMNYKFIIKFVGVLGIPKNMDDFLSTIDLVKPAHLLYEIQYIYVWWQDFVNKNIAWNIVKTITWNDMKVFE